MPLRVRNRLHFGPYRTTSFSYGQKVECLLRGEVTIVKVSSGRIPWPIAKGPGGLALVLFKE